MAKRLPYVDSSEPLRFIDFASPIFGADGKLRGVIAAHVLWHWVSNIIKDFLQKNFINQNIEAFVINQKNAVIHPYGSIDKITLPERLPNDGQYQSLVWADQQRYLTAVAKVHSDTATDMGWRVILRLPIDIAFAPVNDLHRSLLMFSTFVTLITGVVAYLLARALSRPVESIARIARSIEKGDENTPIIIESNLREILQLTDAMRGMTNTLLVRKRELEVINRTLEERVRLRTQALLEANQELEHLVRYDVLTGILNRRAFTELLKDEFFRMKRTGHCYAILLIDIDYFKRVNDTYGHDAGDIVLKHVASVLESAIRATDHIARLGGEEFVILLTNTSEGGGEIAAEKIRAAVANSTAPLIGQVTVSIGLAVASTDDEKQEAAVTLADKAMYRAKMTGRNRVVLASNLDS
ncbi:MAG: diguanylate cyclase [Candidatus Competibacteraceae bacterium]|nr:diguanylate cyclase [Candidatus Competibacteraceae bacterium]